MAKKQRRDLGGLIDLKERKEVNNARAVAKKKKADQSAATKQDDAAEKLKVFSFRMRPSAKQQFAILAKELGMKEQDLIAEALNDLFSKHGKPPIG